MSSNLVSAIIIALFLTILNRVFLPKYVDENQDGRITQDYYLEKLPTDILFVGSSTVYSGISPVILWEKQGFTSYDRSNASQPMWTSYYLIEDAVSGIGSKKPQLVVLDVGFIKYDDEFAEEPSNRKAIDGMRTSFSKLRCALAAMGENERLIEYIFPVLRFHTRWKELSASDLRYAFSEIETNHNGFLMNFIRTQTLPERSNGRYLEKEDTELTPRNVEYLKKIIELCRRKDISLFLMKTPSYSDNWSYSYDDQIREIAGEYGIEYVNFDDQSDAMGIDYRTDSPDEGNHLNLWGAEKFSAYLADYIAEHYTVSSHSGEERYRRVWEEKVLRYEKARESEDGA
ncbi:MAG: SGNH/GDSL hydrolase family protein [Lachnospiraceae bacterium]|nr:SGNH/GDSL hydrolase family protein [Lachnospiraceae bacterium]